MRTLQGANQQDKFRIRNNPRPPLSLLNQAASGPGAGVQAGQGRRAAFPTPALPTTDESEVRGGPSSRHCQHPRKEVMMRGRLGRGERGLR